MTSTTRVLVDVATAIELLHTFALVHDDVMDQAASRRGVPTIHVALAERHRRLGGRGDDVHFGQSVAILVGDLAFAQAAHLVRAGTERVRSGVPRDVPDLMAGQYLDLAAAAQGPRAGVEVAAPVAELKTARYTVEGPLLVGAAAAGRLEDLRPTLERYGRPLGHAFQLRDDLLGAFGDPARTGKPVGDDLAQGKVTGLLELGLVLADEAGQGVLLGLGTASTTPGDVERARDVLVVCGARARVEETIEELVARAVAAVDGSPLAPVAVGRLVAAAHLVASRDS